MATSGVTPSDIDTNLDRPLTSTETDRLSRWITDAETLIALRIPPTVDLDPGVFAMVVRMAVEERWDKRTREGGATSKTVTVDDGTVTRRYESDKPKGAAWWFLSEWWDWLNPAGVSGAFSTRPSFEPDYLATERWA